MAIVVLFFLQDWKAMILPMIDVPVSLVGTFAVMALLGFSLNNLTLFGLVLAIGIVVDDAIVVLENIERQIANGLDPRSATIKAMGEITGPIVAITLVLTSVFSAGGHDCAGHHRPVLSAVCADDRGVDGDFGHQCDDAYARPRRGDLQDGSWGRPRAARGAALVDFRSHRRRRGGDLWPAAAA